MTKFLIDNGADINKKNSALEYISDNDQLLKYPIILQTFLDTGLNVNFKGRYGTSLLHRAILRDYVDAVKILVDNGAMIAWTGLIMYKAGNTIKVEDSTIRPYERTDDIIVTWR